MFWWLQPAFHVLLCFIGSLSRVLLICIFIEHYIWLLLSIILSSLLNLLLDIKLIIICIICCVALILEMSLLLIIWLITELQYIWILMRNVHGIYFWIVFRLFFDRYLLLWEYSKLKMFYYSLSYFDYCNNYSNCFVLHVSIHSFDLLWLIVGIILLYCEYYIEFLSFIYGYCWYWYLDLSPICDFLIGNSDCQTCKYL